MQTKNFIVPHDFTAVADIALQHAIATAKPLGAEIQVLHVVSKDTQIPEALAQLENIIGKFEHEGVRLKPNVRIGSISRTPSRTHRDGHPWRSWLATHHRKPRS